MKNLTDLPIELILMIFNYLEYDDLIVLKSLNEEWTDLIGYCIQSKIVIINETKNNFNKLHRCDKLYSVGRSSNEFKLNRDLHFWIKKLVLYYPNFILDFIDFDNLIDLEIYLNVKELKSKHSDQLLLRIKNLKYLKFIPHSEEFKICLDTPKLTNLDLCNTDMFVIIHPLTIEYLKTDEFDESINQLINLVHLYLFRLDIREIGHNLNRFKRLKKISFYNALDDLNLTQQFFRSILLLKPTLKIDYKEIDLNSDLNLSEIESNINPITYYFLNDRYVQIYMNYIDHISNFTQADLCLENLDLISTKLIQKLTNLECLKIKRITDQEKWIRLLSLPKLTSIRILDFVDQEFLNLIPKYCKFLDELVIDRFDNVEWLLKLKYLEVLEIYYQFDFEVLKKLINNLKYLRTVKFYLKDESYEIDLKNGNIKCRLNRKTIPKYIKSLSLKMIDIFFLERSIWRLKVK